MKHLKIKNILNYKIFLKNKATIDLYINKINLKKSLKIYFISNTDYNTHLLWKLKQKIKLKQTKQPTIFNNFENKYNK